MRENLLELSDNLFLRFSDITIADANQVDFDCEGEHFSENRSILKNLKYKIIQNGNTIFDSDVDYYGLLDYNLAVEICDILRGYLHMTSLEIYNYENLCRKYLNDPQGSKMPIEMLIAQNILNKSAVMSTSELLNTEVKRYEKIQIALRILKWTE